MSGEVRVFAQYDRDVYESCDVVVVGSGPGGAVVAKEVAAAGRDVVLVEEGPPFTPDDFVLDGALSMARTMREGGLRTTRGGFIMPTMQAIALGGGSLVNSAICVRSPELTLDDWCDSFRLERTSRAELDPHYDAVERFLGVAPTPDEVQGARNLLFRDGCRALGWSSEPIPRNVVGCRGSGECFTGCRSRAKRSTDLSYVPAAVRDGARVLTSARAERVLTWGRRRATGIEGSIVRPFTGEPTHRFRVDAKAVVLAAGCMATPVLLQRSGNLANSSGTVGEFLQFHPGVAVLGVFPDRTEPQFGATQGYQSLEFVRRGFKLETLWAPPGVLAVRLPGFGFDLKANLARFPYAAIWDAFASCNRSFGRIRARRRSFDPAIRWSLHPADLTILGEALWVLAQMFFAAGARAILPGVHRLPDEMSSLAEAEVLRTHDYRATDLTCGGNHVFGTTRMHGDPKHGVVDEDGRCHDLDNLYVADTGILPRSPSVNPMLTLMAIAHRIAGRVAERV
ncbi:MAG TPA: GMC family oxidoreductase [Candidatus Binatia bacterium]|nr:GMC family oxidoreductase [Candidatus Binatia bacterium]